MIIIIKNVTNGYKVKGDKKLELMINKNIGNKLVRLLDFKDDLENLQLLCEDCIDYYKMNGGTSCISSAAEELFEELPPGKDYDDKSIVGLFTNQGILIGIIETIRNYPSENTWFIGQMMMASKYRNKGLGKIFLIEFCKQIIKHNAKKIRLAVLKENIRGYHFWRKMGFEVVEKRDNYRIGDKLTTALVMEKEL